MVTGMSAGSDVTYCAGAGWDKSGDFKGVGDWDAYLDQAAQRWRAPVVVTIARK